MSDARTPPARQHSRAEFFSVMRSAFVFFAAVMSTPHCRQIIVHHVTHASAGVHTLTGQEKSSGWADWDRQSRYTPSLLSARATSERIFRRHLHAVCRTYSLGNAAVVLKTTTFIRDAARLA